ncbi:pilus assembly protein CpaE [Marinicauda salina]|uniref:Pilus assembly protein CpaE n=1 Tax=Marinicauda salina TaxID=2135793 RepID=A0A2U2BXL9_9PROT|nr:AAA family ATPase [Marinicauda salina]PWE18768.1 pilus assembly protein CpaE [Marinicauda salina]
MSQANAFDDDEFAPSDEFVETDATVEDGLEVEDAYEGEDALEADDALDVDASFEEEDAPLDPESVERRILGETETPDAGTEGDRPFGARLAEANVDAVEIDLDEFGDAADEAAPETAPAGAETRLTVAETPVDLTDEEAGFHQPVPRITIHAFCESPETGALIHNAGSDRRLAKAHVTVELGGLSGAIERFHDESTPNLLIVETGMRGRALFEQLDELAAVCDADTKVIIVGAANDVTLYRELIRRGVSEYLVPPLTPLHLIRTISELFLDPEAPFAGKTVAFIGAKGGVGSSTVAHNASWCMSEGHSVDTVLVDLDLSFGTAGLDFNQDPAQTISEALNEPDRLDEALLDRLLVRCTDRLSLFSAPATLESEWDFSPDAYDTVLETVRRQAPFVTLDLPHAWNPWIRSVLLSSDQVVVTVTPDLACLRNAKNLFDLVRQHRPNDEPPKVVVNMAGCPKRPDIPLKDFADALGASPSLVLPFEPQLFGKAANNGQMISEVEEKSKAAEGFAHLAGLISGRTTNAGGKSRSRGLFKSLFGKG